MIIQTELVLPHGLSDWACIKVTDNDKSKTVSIFIPLAEKAHPGVSTEEAVQRVAIERFKQQ